MDQQTQDRIVVATVTEAGFVGIEWDRDRIEQAFNHIHQTFDPKDWGEIMQNVSDWKDKAPQYEMAGGFAHRIYHGHSLNDIATIYHQYGLEGVLASNIHDAADFCSPDGLPLPFAKELMDHCDLNVHEAVQLLTFNSTDLIACSVGIPGLALIPDPTVKAAASMAKLFAGIAHSDPSLIITASVGCLMSVYYVFSELSNRTKSDLRFPNFREVDHIGSQSNHNLIFTNFKQVHL